MCTLPIYRLQSFEYLRYYTFLSRTKNVWPCVVPRPGLDHGTRALPTKRFDVWLCVTTSTFGTTETSGTGHCSRSTRSPGQNLRIDAESYYSASRALSIDRCHSDAVVDQRWLSTFTTHHANENATRPCMSSRRIRHRPSCLSEEDIVR